MPKSGSRSEAELLHRFPHFRARRASVFPSSQAIAKCADEIGSRARSPRAARHSKNRTSRLAQKRQDDGERVFGEKLLPAEHDHEEADASSRISSCSGRHGAFGRWTAQNASVRSEKPIARPAASPTRRARNWCARARARPPCGPPGRRFVRAATRAVRLPLLRSWPLLFSSPRR